MSLLIPRKSMRIFQEDKNHQYFRCLFANLEKKKGDVFLARIILAIHLKQICLGKQYGPKDDGDQCCSTGWCGAAFGNV